MHAKPMTKQNSVKKKEQDPFGIVLNLFQFNRFLLFQMVLKMMVTLASTHACKIKY